MQIHIPLIDKRTAQIISMTDSGIQLMDSETFETIDATLVDDEIKDRIQQGQDVEYWKVMDRTKIMRIKS